VEFHKEDDGSLSLEFAVHQAVGAASVCWESMENTGVFQEDKARDVAQALLAFIKDRESVIVELPDHLLAVRDRIRETTYGSNNSNARGRMAGYEDSANRIRNLTRSWS